MHRSTLRFSLEVTATGLLDGQVEAATIFAGRVNSEVISVSRTAGLEAAVAVDISSLSGLPDDHSGYFFEHDETLPRTILPGPRVPPPVQVMGVQVTLGVMQLEVSWTAGSDADGYRVQWRSGEEDYDESRQAVNTGGATTENTITGLTAGAEYTVRVDRHQGER